MDIDPKLCNTCGCNFDADPDCIRPTLKNQRFAATLDGDLIQECCEACQQEIECND
tara:strand:- start:6225 stop:6392 length:168 start_codon:yes stop_codon:yes gene_type:complete